MGKVCGANAETFERVKTWLASTPHSWLLIIDNADDPKIDYATYFPSGSRGNIILTTRNPQRRELAPLCSEDLDHLDRQDAKSLLFNAAKMDASLHEANQKAAEKVVQALSFHTLAIIQAGAFIKNRRFSFEQYSTLFKTQEKRILENRLTQEESTYGSVFATFEISATHMQSSQDQSAADALSLLRILGFFHFQEMPESIFSRAWEEALAIREQVSRGRPVDVIYLLSELQGSRLPLFMMQQNETTLDLFLGRWRETLSLLESYSLIKISGSGGDLSFSMHPLVHTWTRIRHELTSQKEGWRAAGSIIALSMRGLRYDLFHEKLRSHVGAYLAHPLSEYMVNMSELEIHQTHYHICCLLLEFHETSRVRQLLDMHDTFKAWTSATGISGLWVRSVIALCLIQEGQPKDAVELLEWLYIERSDDPSVLGLLARAYKASNQHQKAISLLEPVVKIRGKTEEADNANLLLLYHELGTAYVDHGQSEKAVTILEHVVEMRKKTMAPAHPKRLLSEFDVGNAYIINYEYKKAAKTLQQVLEILRGIVDVENVRLLHTQYQLARAYIGMGSGHYNKAAGLLEQVLEINERTSAPNDPNVLESQYQLAKAYIGMGSDRYDKAVGLLERVIRIRERTPEPGDPRLLLSQRLLEVVHTRIEVEKNAESRSAS